MARIVFSGQDSSKKHTLQRSKSFIRKQLQKLSLIDFRTDITIELLDECYFEGQRVSQVINSNINQLLVALWDDPGYYKIERRQYDKKTTYISDSGNIENNIHCTDLIQISSENEENMSYNHYFISRTKSAINVVDIVREKIYCLY